MNNDPVVPTELPNADILAWVDTETTGLNEKAHRIIDLCVILTDAHLNILEEYTTKIALTPIDRAAFEPVAMKINGYTDKEWVDAPQNSSNIWRKVKEMTDGREIYGQNVEFDEKFLRAEMARYGLRTGWGRRRGDTALLSMRVKHVFGTANAKLDTVYPTLGGPPLPAHRARPDVLRAMYLYDRLLIQSDGLSKHAQTSKHFTHLLRAETEAYVASQTPQVAHAV